MTVLIVGGRGQGKRRLACELFSLAPDEVLDGASCDPADICAAKALVDLHYLTRRLVSADEPVFPLGKLLQGKIVTCDELGCGVVPVERGAEEWREATGRLCCDIAAEADVVIRVIAGIPQIIKGQLQKKTDEIK